MLEDDGILFLQIAGLRRNWTAEDFTWGMFMSKYVFPGADASMPLSFVCNNLERAGFEIHSVENIGIHYSLHHRALVPQLAQEPGRGGPGLRRALVPAVGDLPRLVGGGLRARRLHRLPAGLQQEPSSFDRKRWIGERGRLVDILKS